MMDLPIFVTHLPSVTFPPFRSYLTCPSLFLVLKRRKSAFLTGVFILNSRYARS
jgi:hypothetical protein